jgi:hypothetical protein
MGILLNVDLETNRGPSQEVFIRIENYKVSLTLAEVTFTTTAWIDKKAADNFLRQTLDEPMKNAQGILGLNVVYYKEGDQEGTELEVKNLYKYNMITEKEVTIPIYTKKEISKEVPKVSFDEEGNEITIFKTVTETIKVKDGEETVTKELIDYSILDRLQEVSYEHLKKELSKLFPLDKITIV